MTIQRLNCELNKGADIPWQFHEMLNRLLNVILHDNLPYEMPVQKANYILN